MLDLSEVHQPVAAVLRDQLEAVAILFERQLASDLTAVNSLCRHVERYRGKMLRPTLVLLSGLGVAGTCDGKALSEKHRVLAAVTEMIHMATLVHDDVLDEAEVRRQGDTLNHLHGNETAVMLGDYLISNAFHLCSTLGDPSINLALGEVTNTLCEGELVQLRHRDDYGIDEQTYFEIVSRKTASLIGECCRLGAIIAGADAELAEAMRRFGIRLGVAFQIQDDLLDLTGRQSVVGKSLGKDLEKGKLTLPVIRHLVAADAAERGAMIRLIESRDAETIRQRLRDSGAVSVTLETAQQYVEEARSELAGVPASPARDLLHALADAVVTREF